ncbi:MAG TPA: transporter substrate-binding domain-containing protein [Leptolyngbyaceae cyanobacterium]
MMNAIARKSAQFIKTRHKNIWWGLVCGILVLLLVGSPVRSQQPNPQPASLVLATRAIPPFVFDDKGELSGFSIDLWRSIAKEIGTEFKFVEYPTVADLLSSVESGKANAGIAAISITAERQQKFDFSLPMFNGGLQILVRNPKLNSGSALNILSLFFSITLLQVIGLALLLMVIAAHIIWLFERHHPEAMIPKSYFPGIFKACWWAAATLATQADEMPKGVISRVLAIIWMFIGVLFVAYFTAVATTSLTVQQLQADINSIEDLRGRLVATTTGSTAATYLKENRISIIEVPKIEQAYEALESKKADAVVFDAPVLLYYAANQGQGRVEVVGSIFREENYGIVLPNNSPYRKPINSALLKLKENGTYQLLYDKWFSVKKIGD